VTEGVFFGQHGHWFFQSEEHLGFPKKIRYTENEHEADMKIFFVEHPHEAGGCLP